MYTYIINPGLISTLNYTWSPTHTNRLSRGAAWLSWLMVLPTSTSCLASAIAHFGGFFASGPFSSIPGHCPVTSSLSLLVTILNPTYTYISAHMIKVTGAYITLIYYHGDTSQAPMLLSMQAVRVIT